MPIPTSPALVIPPVPSDDDPYARRMRRGGADAATGPGAGLEPRGDGHGAGADGEGTAAVDSPASQPSVGGDRTPHEPLPDRSRELALAAPDNVPPPMASDKAGAYGARGRRRDADTGATPQTEAAVESGLAWLARVQSPDGHWNLPGDPANKDEHYALGCTSLATLAFLGAGYTHDQPNRYRAHLRRALKWILARQQPGGAFRWEKFYEQGLATMVLCETYGMTRDEAYKDPAQRALNHIASQIGDQGGYAYDGPGNDMHVTSFQIMALKSGKLAKLEVAPETFDRLRHYMDAALHPDGTTGYGISATPGTPTSTRTAVGLFSRLFLDYGPDHPDCAKIAAVLRTAGPQLGNCFQTYNSTYAMFQMGGQPWTDWNRGFAPAVLALQNRQGEHRGSWEPTGPAPGRVVQTAFFIMSLEVYYRFLPVNK